MKILGIITVVVLVLASLVFAVAAVWALPEPVRSYVMLSVAFSIAASIVMWLMGD